MNDKLALLARDPAALTGPERMERARLAAGIRQGSLLPEPVPHFDGQTYDAGFDYARLGRQMRAVAHFMLGGGWHTLDEIAGATGHPEASVSARLRDLRKPKFGSHTVDRRHRGAPGAGLYEYRLLRRA